MQEQWRKRYNLIQEFMNKIPVIKGKNYVHERSVIIGEVTAGEYFSSWPGAVIRADVAPITIGDRCSIQDNTTLHVSKKEPIIIGDDTHITHGAVLHSCTIGNRCFISMGAIVLDGAIIEDDCMIAAGAVVPPGKKILAGSVVMGIPGRVVRQITDKEKFLIADTTNMYIELINEYGKEA